MSGTMALSDQIQIFARFTGRSALHKELYNLGTQVKALEDELTALKDQDIDCGCGRHWIQVANTWVED